MPEYRNGFLGDRPRKRPRSSSPRVKNQDISSPRRRSFHENHRTERASGGRERSKSPPPRRRNGSRSPRDHERPRIKRRYSDESTSPAPNRRRRSRDRRKHSDRYNSDSRSPPPRSRRRNSRDRDRDRDGDRKPARSANPPGSPDLAPSKRSKAPLPSQQAAFTKTSPLDDSGPNPNSDQKPEKQKPNYAPSGLLAAETNTVANTSIVLKYNEPPESRLPPPSQPWRLYVFKNKDLLDTIPLHTRPCWLFGREKAVCDVAVEHPSASKQHAVLQFRYVEKVVGEFGERKGAVGLYVLDLESANGTKLNGEGVPGRRFLECRTGDVIHFGESTREYVVLLPPKE